MRLTVAAASQYVLVDPSGITTDAAVEYLTMPTRVRLLSKSNASSVALMKWSARLKEVRPIEPDASST